MADILETAPDNNDSEIITLIAGIAKALVDSPGDVTVEAIPDQDATILRLHVAQGDVGKIIGKQGRTARSLRTILSAASMKVHRRYSLDIIDLNNVAGKTFGDGDTVAR